MKNIYIPGLTTTCEQLDVIESLFKREGLEIESLFGEYYLLSKMSKKEIEEAIQFRIQTIAKSQKVNMICHSFGCNLGVLTQKYANIHKLVLVSPEFRNVTKDEKKRIQQIMSVKYANEEEVSSGRRSLKEELYLISLFLRSKKWISKDYNKIEVPTMVAYSEGDQFVSRKGISEIAKQELVTLGTSYHNPFLSEVGPVLVKKIHQFIED